MIIWYILNIGLECISYATTMTSGPNTFLIFDVDFIDSEHVYDKYTYKFIFVIYNLETSLKIFVKIVCDKILI